MKPFPLPTVFYARPSGEVAREPMVGIERMERYQGHRPHTQLCRGLGNLRRVLGITRAMNGESLLMGRVPIWAGEPVPESRVGVSPRIGIGKAVERLWRFYKRGNPHGAGRWH